VQEIRLFCEPLSRPELIVSCVLTKKRPDFWELLVLLERYSHEGFLIKVVAMALAGEVARELSPIRSWSNKDYDLKLTEKAREQELQVREATSADTFPFAQPAGAQKILFTPAVRSRVHICTWAYFFSPLKIRRSWQAGLAVIVEGGHHIYHTIYYQLGVDV